MSDKGLDKFNGQGFHTWQMKIKGYLMRKQLWSVTKPLEPNETLETRKGQPSFADKNEQALGMLLTSLDDNYVHFLDNCDSAHEAWHTLEQNFGAIAKNSKVALKMQLYDLNMHPGEDLPSLINRLKSLCTQLAYIRCPIDNEDQVAVLLKAVPDEIYSQIITVLKEKDPTPQLSDVINSLQQHGKKEAASPSSGTYLAKIASSKNIKCSHCGRNNHLSKDCYQINPCKICGKTNHGTKFCLLRDDNKASISGTRNNNKTSTKSQANTVEDSTDDFVYDEIL